MSDFTRFAIYYLPPEGALERFGAAWLGWDVAAGLPAPHLDVPGLATVTATPRKYGFHGTLKPPFRLAEGTSPSGLHAALQAMAATQAPVAAERLVVAALGRFLALIPANDSAGLAALAARCVTDFDSFRAPASAAELDKRRASGLTPRQDALLARWGYPYVLDEFRFHMTLSGKLPPEELKRLRAAAEVALPPLSRPYVFQGVALVGERPGGTFQLIHRYTFTG